jgi:hypothetical protein
LHFYVSVLYKIEIKVFLLAFVLLAKKCSFCNKEKLIFIKIVARQLFFLKAKKHKIKQEQKEKHQNQKTAFC